jgi:hypothetical protein
MDINIYNNDIDAQVVEIFSNDVISCVATCDIANRFETLTDAECAGIKDAFMRRKDIPAYHSICGKLTSAVSGRLVCMDYFFKTQHADNGDFMQFTIHKLDIKD